MTPPVLYNTLAALAGMALCLLSGGSFWHWAAPIGIPGEAASAAVEAVALAFWWRNALPGYEYGLKVGLMAASLSTVLMGWPRLAWGTNPVLAVFLGSVLALAYVGGLQCMGNAGEAYRAEVARRRAEQAKAAAEASAQTQQTKHLKMMVTIAEQEAYMSAARKNPFANATNAVRTGLPAPPTPLQIPQNTNAPANAANHVRAAFDAYLARHGQMSQAEVARRIGVDIPRLSEALNGKCTDAQRDAVLQKIKQK